MTTIPAAPTATPTAAPARRGSIRTPLLALSLLPALAVGGAWLGTTFTQQAASDRALLLQGATQTSKAFGERILDLEEVQGLTLSAPELRAGVQERAEDLVRADLLPVTDLAVTDDRGRVLVAYARSYAAGSSAVEADTARRWTTGNPALSAAVTRLAQSALKQSGGATERVSLGRGAVTLAAFPLPNASGVTVMALDDSDIQARVRANLLRTVAIVVAVLGLALFAASSVASNLISRLQRLSAATLAASKGDTSVTIPVTGNDELTTVGESADRMVQSNRVFQSLLEDE